MATFLFQKIAKQASAAGIDMTKVKEAREWFRNTARKLTDVSGNQVLTSDPDRFLKTRYINIGAVGRMTMFFYDATTKEKLPYWDRFPLIFPLEIYGDGFLGINLHYLSPINRAKLMDALYTTLQSKGTDDAKLKINYKILKRATKYRLFKACVKRYKWAGVKSRFFIVRPEEWDMMLMLPTERFDSFDKKNILKSQVWAESIGKASK